MAPNRACAWCGWSVFLDATSDDSKQRRQAQLDVVRLCWGHAGDMCWSQVETVCVKVATTRAPIVQNGPTKPAEQATVWLHNANDGQNKIKPQLLCWL